MNPGEFFDLAMFWPDAAELTEEQLDQLIDTLLIEEAALAAEQG